jgi:hypothetical protein
MEWYYNYWGNYDTASMATIIFHSRTSLVEQYFALERASKIPHN